MEVGCCFAGDLWLIVLFMIKLIKLIKLLFGCDDMVMCIVGCLFTLLIWFDGCGFMVVCFVSSCCLRWWVGLVIGFVVWFGFGGFVGLMWADELVCLGG